VLYQNGHFGAEMPRWTVNPDRAYPVLLNLLPVGLKGLSLQHFTAAINLLAGKANSIATILH
jgi:SSS family solute:Na+ symporter